MSEGIVEPCPRRQFLEIIRNLTREEQINFVALALLRRGAYQSTEWNKAIKEAATAYDANHMAECLIGFHCWAISRDVCGIDGKAKSQRCVMLSAPSN